MKKNTLIVICVLICKLSSYSQTCSISSDLVSENGELKIGIGTLVNLTANYQEIGSTTYLWEFGDGNSSAGKFVSFFYDTTACYNTRLTIIEGTDTCETFLKVFVSPGPKINDLPSDISIFLGQTYNLVADTSSGGTLDIDEFSGSGFNSLKYCRLTYMPDEVVTIIPLYYSQFPLDSILTNIDNFSVSAIMEHSYFGDLEVEIKCPNGSNIHLINGYYSETSNNDVFLGEPVYLGTLDDSIPGVGYYYNWTENNPQNGKMEEMVVPYHTYTDLSGSTHYNQEYFQAGSYLPYDNFTSLIGCPLNGQWIVTITDNIGRDDGFIFNMGINVDSIPLDTIWNYKTEIIAYEWTGNNIIGKSNNSAIIQPVTSGSKEYTFSCTDDFGCSANKTINVNVLNNFFYNVSDVTTCDASYNLNAGDGFLSYKWLDSKENILGNQQLLEVDSSGTYIVVVENEEGLLSSDEVSILFNGFQYSAPIIDNPVCEGTNVILDAGFGYYSYSWFFNNTLVSNQRYYEIQQSGEYAILVSNSLGCYSSDTIDFEFYEDNISPVPNITTLPSITGICSATITTIPNATDNCAGTITATTSNPLEYNEQGNYTVTWSYDDGNGNIATQTQNVIVTNNIVPIPNITTLPNITGICSATITTIPTATVNCTGTITATTSNALEYNEQGTYTVTWSYDDGNGNIANQTQYVIVDDNIAPVPDIAALPNITGSCSAIITTIPTATDNCEGIITANTSSPLEYNEQGTYTVTWSYDDGNGNITTQNQTVIVNDFTDPTISCIENQTINLSQGQTFYTVSGTEFDLSNAQDDCEIASITNSFNNLSTLNNAELPIGTTVIIWNVTDKAGNTESCNFNIQVNEFVGISELSVNEFSISPNPTNGLFEISYATKQTFKVIITDLTGKKLIEKTNIRQNEIINLSNYNSGIYIIQLKTNNKIFISKIVKE